MSIYPRKHTTPELHLRSALHALGLRYRLHTKVPGNNRRTIDVAFPKQRVAVFVDGCYWHGCPEHGTQPKTNSEWWSWKFAKNFERDQNTNELLSDAGWLVIRIWEHEDPFSAASKVAGEVRNTR